MKHDPWISPRYRASKLASGAIEDKIDVYEDKIIGWTFNHADVLASSLNPKRRHAGFAILMLCSAYFESLHSCMVGRSGPAKEFFRKGFLEVFPNGGSNVLAGLPSSSIDALLNEIYDEIRCGLYHQLAVKKRVAITRRGKPIRIKLDATNFVEEMLLNPWAILEAVKDHFKTHIAKLRDPSQTAMRANFTKYFDGRLTSQVYVSYFPAGARSTV